MDIKPAGNAPYTEKDWGEYKINLTETLSAKALDADEIFNDPEVKNYILAYMESELINEKKDMERLILNTNIRLVHMDIGTSKGTRTFPLVNEYHGHHLMKTYYFYKENNEVKMGCVEVKPTPIIIS